MTFAEFIQGNKDTGRHYFDTETMRFFASHLVHDSWNGDGFFITSEQFRGFNSPDGPRKWSIRRGNLETFDVDSVGEFQAYVSLARATTALQKLRTACVEKATLFPGAEYYYE